MTAPTDRPFREHPACIFPAWLQALGFRDESWRNEASGRATHDLPDACTLVVWIAEENPADREWPEHPRYHVSLEREYGDPTKNTGLYSGDDAALVQTICAAVLAANGVPNGGGVNGADA
ncbi:MAG TPA: hypothetical protein VH439_17225 [Gemmatimonadales bacterium]|jgi:hypothetical protein